MSANKLLIGIVLLCLTGSLGLYSLTSVGGKGTLALDSDNYDWGTIRDAGDVSHTFKLVNKSKKEVRIKDIRTTCGCTTGSVERRLLKPAESIDLNVKLKMTLLGDIIQHVLIMSDASDQPLDIVLRARFEPPTFALVIPPVVALSESGPTGTNQKSILVEAFSRDDHQIKIESIIGDVNYFATVESTTRVTEKTTMGYFRTVFKVNIAPSSSLPLKSHSEGDLIVKFSDSSIDDIRIPIHRTYAAPIMVQPESVVFVAHPGEIPNAEVVTITVRKGENIQGFTVNSGQEIDKWLRVVPSSQEGSAQFLKITLTPIRSIPDDPSDGIVSLSVMAGDSRENIRIPVKGRVLR